MSGMDLGVGHQEVRQCTSCLRGLGVESGKRQGVFDDASPGCYGSTEEGHLIQPEGVFLQEVASELSLGSLREASEMRGGTPGHSGCIDTVMKRPTHTLTSQNHI